MVNVIDAAFQGDFSDLPQFHAASSRRMDAHGGQLVFIPAVLGLIAGPNLHLIRAPLEVLHFTAEKSLSYLPHHLHEGEPQIGSTGF